PGGVPDRRAARAARRVVRRRENGAGDGRGQRPRGRGRVGGRVPEAAFPGRGRVADGARGARQLPAAARVEGGERQLRRGGDGDGAETETGAGGPRPGHDPRRVRVRRLRGGVQVRTDRREVDRGTRTRPAGNPSRELVVP